VFTRQTFALKDSIVRGLRSPIPFVRYTSPLPSHKREGDSIAFAQVVMVFGSAKPNDWGSDPGLIHLLAIGWWLLAVC